MTLNILTFEGIDGIQQAKDQWQDLLDRSGQPSFFLRADFLSLWAQNFLGNDQLILVVVERGGRWIGGLPLVFGVGPIGGRWRVPRLGFAGTGWFDRMELPAANAEDCEEAMACIWDWAKKTWGQKWMALALQEVPNGSDTMHALSALAQAKKKTLHGVLASKAPMVDLATGGKTSSKYRRQLRQSMETLKERGEVTVDFFHLEESMVNDLADECERVEQSSWKGDEGVGVFRNPAHKEFTKSLWRMLAVKNEASMATIRLDGELVIYHWGMNHQGRFLSYNLAQVPETNSVRGGSLLLGHMVQTGESLGYTVIDASRGSLLSPNIIGRYHGPDRDHANFVLYGSGASALAVSSIRHRLLPFLRTIRKKPGPPSFDRKDTITDF